ncbi:MAG: hypothetical protein HY288_14905, partial [Planctomycetia bacterium]|nr:hypothetical protein [Planctomycetia bacterium]
MIGVGTRWIAGALAAAALGSWASPRAAAKEAGQESPRLEIKHVGRGDRVVVETKGAAKAVTKLVPFPEDEEQPQGTAHPEAEKATSFQPRFKTPAVRQVQHLESAPDENTLKLNHIPLPADAAGAVSAGRA